MSNLDYISERHDIEYRPLYTDKTETHIRQASPLSDVAVPALQAVITGGLFGLTALGAAVQFHWSMIFPATVFTLGAIAMWTWRMIDHSAMLRAVETITRHDLDRDGFIGQPPAPAPQRSFQIDISEKVGAGSRLSIVKVPISDDVFAQFARAALAGQPLTHRAWTGANNPMSDTEYRKTKSILLAEGLMEWGTANGKQTVIVSERGRTVFEKFLQELSTGASDDDDEN